MNSFQAHAAHLYGLPLAPGWRAELVEADSFEWVFGWAYPTDRRIEILTFSDDVLPWYVPTRLVEYGRRFVWLHEVGHSWGIDRCCRPWCIMWEGECLGAWATDNAVEKIIGLPFQAVYRDFCPRCRETIQAATAAAGVAWTP